MDHPPRQPHDIVVHGHTMPTPARPTTRGGPCKCAWPCVTHGRPSGRDGRLGGTSGHTTSDHEKWLCARLLIPRSLLNTIPGGQTTHGPVGQHPTSVPLGYTQSRTRMNRHRITTDLRDGGLGLRHAWWSVITRWITLGQNETLQTGHTDRQLSTTQYNPTPPKFSPSPYLVPPQPY